MLQGDALGRALRKAAAVARDASAATDRVAKEVHAASFKAYGGELGRALRAAHALTPASPCPARAGGAGASNPASLIRGLARTSKKGASAT